MDKYYKLTVAGLQRDLKICPVSDHLDIASFIMFSDVELTVRCAEELLKLAPEFDVLLTAEAKSIPLAYEMARQSGKPYIPVRKGKKAYMTDPVCVNVKSITTANVQTLYLDKKDLESLRDKRVLIVDDVISTGMSLKAMEEFVEKAQGIIAAKAAVLAEGEAADRTDIIFLEKLPVFPK
ncbi:phosphoribosyltransferase family protein [Hydrogenoanaerobacterium sp.]|uniref:phosphoribosyltransferase family protein n=1 Tax=Hydrogenoanaerobacterium sp. TaxID=2953763 RepID=UPI00289F1329|nr:phosphoribosyltransferase family protein [Hydrogenoanaerobacterium sp.]